MLTHRNGGLSDEQIADITARINIAAERRALRRDALIDTVVMIVVIACAAVALML